MGSPDGILSSPSAVRRTARSQTDDAERARHGSCTSTGSSVMSVHLPAQTKCVSLALDNRGSS
jgi:hypothetical protein